MLYASGLWTWGLALAASVVFFVWYRNWRGPLHPDEIQGYLAKMQSIHGNERNDIETMRRFLEADDGREFVMLNLVKIAPEPVPDPETGELVSGSVLLNRYTRVFLRALFARGGHPAIVARKIGGYFDAWHVPPDPGWTIVGFMRYRSRRDMIELVVDPRFGPAHAFKFAATAETYSFPTRIMLRAYPGPMLWVPLMLALAAALAQITILLSTG
ncbi:MAG: hypothetical protein U0942_09035 [Parvibaculum sp.]|uniref:hypothetical protein n=1 Tax=Parvibaculum sp. TaxID=2024848 RepID=UPI002ABBF43E|nr:hypothetical protein [Parvibaculum sp.]MDZ4381470.1 hypothetical protein [Parvibaculum sp.]